MSLSPPAALPPIFTLTGNLLAERTLEFEGWQSGRTQRARTESFQVGGKGINVAKMLNRLGAANTALCFTGGATGLECETWLTARGFHFRAFRTSTPTRTGTVVRDGSGSQPETTFLGADAAPDASAVQACAAFLDTQPDGQVLALCGSFPGWSSDAFDPLRAALERWIARGHLIADTYGPPLHWAIELPLALIKVNADELRSMGCTPGPSLPVIVRRWVISDGPRSIWLRDEAGNVATVNPPSIKEISPTGSGDVLLACLLQAWFGRSRSLVEAVRFALPFAGANAAHPGVAEFPLPPQAP